MKPIFVVLAFALLATGTLPAQSTQWTEDRLHSKVGFEVPHMMIATVDGKFHDYSVTVLSDKEDFSDSKIDVVIQVKSIDTDNDKRDGHLRGDDFFDADNHPLMTFRGKDLKKIDKNIYTLTGDLTIRGTTKTVTLDVKFGGMTKDSQGNTRVGFKLSGKVNRFDYGLKWNRALEAGGLVAGEMVEIECNVALVKKKA